MSATVTRADNAAAEHAGAMADVPAEPAPSKPLSQVVGTRMYTDGMGNGARMSWLAWITALVTLCIYIGWIYCFALWLLVAAFNRWAAAALVATALTVLLPGQLFWPEFLDMGLFRTWRQYFKYSVVFEEALDYTNSKTYVFAEYPHGVFPMSEMLAATLASQAWPGHRIYSIAANILFHIPLWKHVMLWLGAQPATPQNLRRLLKMGSVAVIPGGIAEMYMQHPTQEQILLSKRKGFVRVAVENGADIVPVYHFGNTQLLTGGPKWIQPHARRLRMSLGYMYGRWGLPLPRELPLMMVCGRPVGVQKLAPDHPDFAAEVDRVLAAVIQEIQRIYDAWKKEYGWDDRPLVIF